MKKILLLILLLFCTNAYSSDYAVERQDGGVSIVNVKVNNIEQELRKLGFEGASYVKVASLPAREDRDYWKLSNGDIVVDENAKKNDKESKNEKEATKELALEQLRTKLGLTKQELTFLRTMIKELALDVKEGKIKRNGK